MHSTLPYLSAQQHSRGPPLDKPLSQFPREYLLLWSFPSCQGERGRTRSAIDEVMMTAVVMMMTMIERCQSVCNAVVSHGHGCSCTRDSCGKINRGAEKYIPSAVLLRSLIDHLAVLIPRALLELVYFARISDLDIYCCRSTVRRPPSMTP